METGKKVESKKKTPLRQCVGCREMKDKKEMVRVLRTAQGSILIDASGRKNGRGAYICRKAECFEKARKSKALARSLKINIPEEIYDELKKEFYDSVR